MKLLFRLLLESAVLCFAFVSGPCAVAKNLARLDQRYDSMFNDAVWKDCVGARSESFSHAGQ